jgi:scyllo-inositol 2-dehydrogenase (NADP+)
VEEARFFHAPLIAATDGLTVDCVVTSSPDRSRQVTEEYPEAEIVSSPEELWNRAAPELVVVASPNGSHAELAAAAIDHGVPVVVDKPLALTASEGESLVERAAGADVMLTVFQNRRWDTDQLTLRRLIGEAVLGDIRRYESRFERWQPEPDPGKWRQAEAPEQGGGLLLDLGSHLVDQALSLFGPATHVYAEIAARRGLPSDDDVFVALEHANGTVSHLLASAVAPAPGPRLRVQGTLAGFVVAGLDPQEEMLREGLRPDSTRNWGLPPESSYGQLVAGDHMRRVAPEPGDWPRFYRLVAAAIRDGGPPPVDPGDAVAALRVLDAAALSARERRVVMM